MAKIKSVLSSFADIILTANIQVLREKGDACTPKGVSFSAIPLSMGQAWKQTSHVPPLPPPAAPPLQPLPLPPQGLA